MGLVSRVRTVAFGLALLISIHPLPARAAVPGPVPRADCGPGGIAEGPVQGRVTAAAYTAGTGSACNFELLGHAGKLGGFRTYRYVDDAGRECAFYDTTAYLPGRPEASLIDPQVSGVHVLDMTDPTNPVPTVTLNTPAMRSPHESLDLHRGRGLLAANAGSATTMPGFVDVYSVKEDCRYPRLLSSTPLGIIGHEGSFSPDGLTYWVSAGAGFYTGTQHGTIVAIDVSNPVVPAVAWATGIETAHGFNISDDGNTLYYADVGPTKGLTVLDVSQVQARVPNPAVTRVGHLTWETVSIPQTDIPVTIDGHPYLVEVDEFNQNGVPNLITGASQSRPEDLVGAARIIDVADASEPSVVSDIRLEVNQPEARAGDQKLDPNGDNIIGYAAHYCAVPRRDDPKIVACSFILSGLRVFNIEDPAHPREIAYFNPPTTSGTPYAAMSAPTFVPERNEIWYTDGNYGFYSLRMTNDVWPS